MFPSMGSGGGRPAGPDFDPSMAADSPLLQAVMGAGVGGGPPMRPPGGPPAAPGGDVQGLLQLLALAGLLDPGDMPGAPQGGMVPPGGMMGGPPMGY
ncbi:MAG: hypothetical protein IRY99_26805 [Isosphaeraceae bacterium]|nr:hypothetical protein [Isosphaeraceae bacterium]